MTTRRAFLGASTAAIAAAACTPPGSSDEENSSDLPASLKDLTTRKDEAVPITLEERHGRIEKAQSLMGAAGIDAICLTGGTSLRYFTNIAWGLSERMFAVILPRTSQPFLVTPAFERDRAMEQAQTGPLADQVEIMTWEEHESPYQLVAAGLRSRGIVSGRLGIEETVRWVFSDGIAAETPAIALTSATSITAGCRSVKSATELALMQLASEVTLAAYHAAWSALREGMTQGDVARLVREAHDRLGFAGGAGVQVGEYSALPHGSVTPQTIREGTILLIDGGCKVEGYSSDLSRTFILGTPTQRMKDVFDVELEAQSAALAAARPGVPCEAVDAAARAVIDKAGFGPGYRTFTHRVGHGIGMDGHEWPYLVKGNTLPLAPGMTFSDEPGIYLPGEFGIRLEDDMVITEDGARLMTPQSTSLETPFEA